MSRELKRRLVQFRFYTEFTGHHTDCTGLFFLDATVCLKCQEDNGTLVHLLWECPKIQEYWSSVHKVLEKIVSQDILFCSRLYILRDFFIIGSPAFFSFAMGVDSSDVREDINSKGVEGPIYPLSNSFV